MKPKYKVGDCVSTKEYNKVFVERILTDFKEISYILSHDEVGNEVITYGDGKLIKLYKPREFKEEELSPPIEIKRTYAIIDVSTGKYFKNIRDGFIHNVLEAAHYTNEPLAEYAIIENQTALRGKALEIVSLILVDY